MSAHRSLVRSVLALLVGLGLWSTPARAFQLPPYTKTVLSNGITVYLMPSKRLPLVDLRLQVRAGSVDDPPGREGLANLTAELLTQGAGKRSARQIAEDIEFVGGDLSADADLERTTVSCEVLSKDFAIGLASVRDVVRAPTFAAAEFDRKQAETLGGIASDGDDPSASADRMLAPLLWGDGPLGHPESGWEPSVKATTREDVASFHQRYYRPDRIAIAVVGDMDPKVVLAQIQAAFGDWKANGTAPPEVKTATPQIGRQVRIIEKPEVTQTQVRMACQGVPRNHPDYDAIRVANTILGGGFTSRLVNEMRVNQGLTYGISSRFRALRATGDFRVVTSTKNESLRKIIDGTLSEIGKLRDQGPTQAELDKSKRYLTGQFPLGLQAPDDLAVQLLDIDFYPLDPKTVETFADRIGAISMEDVKRALKSYFCTDQLRILVVSDPATAKPALQGLGTVDVAAIR